MGCKVQKKKSEYQLFKFIYSIKLTFLQKSICFAYSKPLQPFSTMKKILNASQIRALDAYTIQHEPIASIDLMERASWAFVACLRKHFEHLPAFEIYCGLGNNGGDGLAIARLLHERGCRVKVWVVRHAQDVSIDFFENYKRLEALMPIEELHGMHTWVAPSSDTLVVDALLGSGINRPVKGILQDIIHTLNLLPNTKIAVDIPSGLYVDKPVEKEAIVLQAQLTISFQVPKLAFLLPENHAYVGKWEVVDIGLSEAYLASLESLYFYMSQVPIKPRAKFSHKGSFGHALLLVGKKGSIGAAVLAARACLRSGIGLLTTHIPACGYDIMQTSVPEALCSTDSHAELLTELPDLSLYQAIGVGCGIGKAPATAQMLETLLKRAACPLVFDADAINLLAEMPQLLPLLKPNTILTPHPKELQRLLGSWENDYEKLRKTQDFCQHYGVIVLIKGMHTAVVLPDRKVYFNATGNAGMATGGSADPAVQAAYFGDAREASHA